MEENTLMSRGNRKKKRRSIIRPGAGGAILRFLIGVVLLIAVCGFFYLFILQGTVNITLPIQDGSASAEPTAQVTAAPTAVPTIEPTAAATAAPSPEPTATPIPPEEMAQAAQLPDGLIGLPELPDARVKLGLKELNLFDAAGQSVIIVRGYAFIEGQDAAQSQGYILLTDPTSGATLNVYPVSPRTEDADLSFDETAGANLDQAFFRMSIDVSGLPDGYYIVCMALENGGRTAWNYFDDSMYHFRVDHGLVMLFE